MAIEGPQAANQTYFDEGIKIFELAQNAYTLFLKQKPLEKRRLLNFLLSNCTWKHGELHAEFRQPFDILAVTAMEHARKKAAGVPSDQLFANWLPKRDSNRSALQSVQAADLKPENAGLRLKPPVISDVFHDI